MSDLIYVAAVLALVFLAALFVVGCDHLVGSDEQALAEEGPEAFEHEPHPGAERAAA